MRKLGLVLLTGALLFPAFAPADTGAAGAPRSDLQILRAAAGRLGTQSQQQVIQWLWRQSTVAAAQMGRDGKTVQVDFRDGQTMMVLPRVSHVVRLPAALPLAAVHLRPHQATGARAAVWEPFATELGLGPAAGDPEQQKLQVAGFRISTLYDTAVTVSAMATISSYNVVYMHTHSGVAAGGDGVVATGELANGDPAVAPLVQDGSVVSVGVAGDNTNAYYAVTSRFFTLHVAPFQRDSLLFLNGCKLLPATTLWQTLQSRGVGVMVSWSDDATAQDDYLSAAGFFNYMSGGLTVANAISSLIAAGYGTSTYNGVSATLGYRGDGTITLRRAGQGQTGSATATPLPTGTGAPSPTSTRVPVPTGTRVPPPAATATPTSQIPPPPLHISAIARSVTPGKRQQINVQTAPGVPVQVRVTFPNGDAASQTVTADASGNATVSFVQPKNTVTRTSSRAVVAVQAGSGTLVTSVSDEYTVGFAAIDIVAGPRQVKAGSTLKLWVHTHARTAVTVTAKAGKTKKTLHLKTGAHGWGSVTYRVPSNLSSGARVALTASARIKGKTQTTSDGLLVR